MSINDFLANAELLSSWDSYKSYLQEKGYKIETKDYESEELFKLFMISGQNIKTAIFILNRIIAGSYNCI